MPEEAIARPQPLSPLAVSGDMAARLPAPVRKKLKALRGLAEEQREYRLRLSAKRTALMERIPKFADEIEAMTLPLHAASRFGNAGRGLAEGSAEVREARLQLASAREDLEAANAIYADGRAGTTASLVASLESFLRARPAMIFKIAPAEPPPRRKGETLPDAIENRRRRLRELAADREAVMRAPLPSTLSKQTARAQLAELAQRGRPDVFGLIEFGRPIEWPRIPVTSAMQDLPQIIRETVDGAALMCWALGPALVEAIEREIDLQSDDAHALTTADRRKRLAEIDDDRLAVEREEEALIEMAEAEGLQIFRRSNADPRAVLGIVCRVESEDRNAA